MPIRATPPLPTANPQAARLPATPPPLPPSTDITSGLPEFHSLNEDLFSRRGKEKKQGAKKPPVAAQIVGVIGAIAGAALGRVVGIPMLIAVVLAALVGTPLYFLTTGARRRMVFAGALQAGHALWMLLGAALIAAGNAPGIVLNPLLVVEGIFYLGGAILVVFLPYLPVIILMTVYQVAGLTMNAMNLAHGGLPPEFRNALFLHMFLRALAIAMMFLAYFEKPKDEERKPRNDFTPDDSFDEPARTQLQRPKEVPLGLIFGIILAVIVVVGGAIAAFFAFRTEPNLQAKKGPGPQKLHNPEPDKKIDANNKPDNQPPVRNWQVFTAPDGSFTADFPGPVKHTTRKADNTNRTIHIYEFDEGKNSFRVMTFDPPLPGRPAHLFQTLRSLRSEFDEGTIEPERPITLGTYKGYEFTIRYQNRVFVQRMFKGHGRDFTVRVSAPHIEAIARDAERFFSSFQPEGMDRAEKPPAKKPSNQEQPRIFQGAGSDILFLTFDRKGKNLTAVCQNGEYRLWGVESGFTRNALEFPKQPVRFLAYAQSQDGKTAAACTLGGKYYFLDPATFKPKTVLQDKLTKDIVWSLAVSADGKMVAAGHDNRAVVWNPTTLGPQWSFFCKGRANALAFSPDGKILAVGTRNNTIHLWDPRGGQEMKPLVGKQGGIPSPGAVWAVAISPDNKTLAAGGHDRTVRLWDLPARTERAQLPHDDTVRSLAISPDGKLLAVGDDGGNLTLWDLSDTSRTAVFPEENQRRSVRALAFSADSTSLAAGCGNDVRLVDTTRVRWKNAEGK
jgi:WD40 repeat protein